MNERQELTRAAAHEYRERGFSVIPVGANKRPLLESWKRYQTERASSEQIEAWLAEWPDMNIGIITGAISGIVVVDIEAGGNMDALPPTVCAKTGGNGWHLYYQHPGNEVKNSVRIAHLTDIRADGGYVLAPPSVSEKGAYEWRTSFHDAELHPYPAEHFTSHTEASTGWRELLDTDVHEGMRNNAVASIAGGLLASIPASEWDSKAWPTLVRWNAEHCKPALSETELKRTFNSIRESEQKKSVAEEKEKTQLSRLMAIVSDNPDVELFRDEYETPYIRVPVNEQKETLNCRSRKFSLWLTHAYYEKYGGMPQPTALSLAIQGIEGLALFKGKRYELRKRVAETEDAIWYDLANNKNHAVRIAPTGWDLVANPPNLFQKEKHMLAQVEPVRGGNVAEFLQFVNISDEGQKLLLLVYLVSCFIPGFPHPLLYLYGQKGSAKSTLSKLLRRLIDPSTIEVVALPKDRRQAGLQLLHHHIIFYENVSHISADISDLLCIAITGGGFEDREFYTNADAFIYNVRTNIGINGINISAVKPDLLERSILIELERISDSGRRMENELYATFEEARPRILGAIFDTAATAMKLRPTIKLTHMPRMADFAAWGCAISEALGFTQEQFLKAYNKKIAQQDEEALAVSQEAQLVIALMQGEDEWSGTPQELLSTLKTIAANQGEHVGRDFAEKPNVLTRRLNQVKTNLLAVGVDYSQKTGGNRLISLKRMKQAARVEGTPEGDKGGSGDDS